MLLIRKSKVIILLAVTVVSIAAMAASAFVLLSRAGTVPAAMLRFQAEKILFIGIIITCCVASGFTLVILRSRNLRKDLDKLVRQNRLNPASTEGGLLKLGEVGLKLNQLYHQMNEISEMRGLKISALTNSAEFLSTNIKDSILIVDVTGKVIQASRGYLQQHDTGRSEIIDQILPLLSKGIQINNLLSRLEKKHLPIETETDGVLYRWVPIVNSGSEISYIAVIQLGGSPN